MIKIIRTNQFPTEAFVLLKKEAFPKERDPLETLEQDWQMNIQRFHKTGEGLFLLIKNDLLIGVGSLEQSPFAPPTAGIALLRYCYLLPSERGQGYGRLLYDYIVRYARPHFGLLQLDHGCLLGNLGEQLIVLT